VVRDSEHRLRSRSRARGGRLVPALLAALVLAGLLQPAGAQAQAAPSAAWTRADPVLLDGFTGSGRPTTTPAGAPYRSWVSPGAGLAATAGSLLVDDLPPGGSFALSAPQARSRDVQLGVDVTAPSPSGTFYAGLRVRTQEDGSHYGTTAALRPDGAVRLTVDRVDGGGTTRLATTTTRVAPGSEVRLELRAVGASPVLVQARLWQVGTPRPAFQATARDAGERRLTAPGALRVGGYLSRGARTVDAAIDDVEAWSFVPSPGAGAGASAATPTQTPTPGVTTAPGPTATSAPATSAPVTAAPTSAAPTPTAAPTSAAPTPTAVPTTAVPVGVGNTSAAGFAHPGIVVSADRLAEVRSQLAAGREPWTSALARTRASWQAELDRRPAPVPVVQCGARNTIDVGCSAEVADAQAAYTDALVFALTGDQRYADKAIEIIDAWSGTLQRHDHDPVLRNGKLQSAWAAQELTKAAELLRHTGSGWSPDGVARFEDLLRRAYLPMVRDGQPGGGANGQLSMAEATMDIGVFLDDRAVFDEGVADWRAQLPAAFYLTSDGPAPVVPPETAITPKIVGAYWRNPVRYVDGLGQESCRDLDHTAMGLGAAVNAAETAWIQGVDLYGEQRERLVAALEHNARYLLDPGAAGWSCPDPVRLLNGESTVTGAVAYRHYALEGGVPMPATAAWLARVGPTRSKLFMSWETLTHGG